MAEITFATLENTPVETIRQTLNEAFKNYLVPFQLTEEQFAARLTNEDVQLELSAGAFDGDKLVGFILHGLREIDDRKVAYNSATGVLAEYRGNHLTTKLYDFITGVLRQVEVDDLLLEVIDGNEPALKTYKKIGFEERRYLRSFRGALPEYEHSFDIQELPMPDRDYLSSFWDVQPGWQADNSVLKKPRTGVTIGAYDNGMLEGYIHFNPINKRIVQIAVHPAHRRKGIGKALLTHLKLYADEAIITHIDQTSEPSIQFFESLGWENFVNLIEMSRGL